MRFGGSYDERRAVDRAGEAWPAQSALPLPSGESVRMESMGHVKLPIVLRKATAGDVASMQAVDVAARQRFREITIRTSREPRTMSPTGPRA